MTDKTVSVPQLEPLDVLREMFQLVTDDILVRNIERDSLTGEYLRNASRLVMVLKRAETMLTKPPLSVPTESTPKWKREQEVADKFRPAVAEIFKLESELPVNDPLRHRLYLVRCELGRIDYDARSKA